MDTFNLQIDQLSGTKMRELVVVIVNYNSYEDCCDCIQSLLSGGVVSSNAIVVVDNHSPDGSGHRLSREFPAVNVILSSANGGFGAGVNMGVRSVPARFYLVLNPDTRFRQGKIDDVLQLFAENRKLGVVGLHLTSIDGESQYAARRFYSALTILLRRTPLKSLPGFFRKLNREHLMMDSWSNKTFEADWVIGAAFVVRAEAFDDVGGMDERYFLYLEDTDLCKRMWLRGWKVKATSRVEIAHAHGRASAKGVLSPAGRHHLKSLRLFHKKFRLDLWGHGTRMRHRDSA